MRFELSLLAYDVVRERETHGDPHPTLARGKLWYDPEERRQLAADVNEEIEQAGLSHNGRLTSAFLDVVHLIERPEVEYYTTGRVNNRSVSIRVARSGRTGVLVIANDDTMFVYPSRADSAIRDVVAQLPGTPAARVQSMSFTKHDLTEAEAGRLLGQSNGSVTDAKAAVRWLKAPRANAGRLYCGVWQGLTRRRTDLAPVWIDTEYGRLLLSKGQNDWMTLSSAAGHDLERTFEELEQALR